MSSNNNLGEDELNDSEIWRWIIQLMHNVTQCWRSKIINAKSQVFELVLKRMNNKWKKYENGFLYGLRDVVETEGGFLKIYDHANRRTEKLHNTIKRLCLLYEICTKYKYVVCKQGVSDKKIICNFHTFNISCCFFLNNVPTKTLSSTSKNKKG
jgi:hypothetical protein